MSMRESPSADYQAEIDRDRALPAPQAPASGGDAVPARRPSFFKSLPRGVWCGGTILLLLMLVALVGPWLTPYDAFSQDLGNRLAPPFWHANSVPGHWLGTDQLGRDYLARLIYGARISLLIGFSVTAVSACIGITLGLIAGYAGGVCDSVISFLITTRLSMPVVLVALAIVSVAGPSLTIVVVVLGLLLWDHFAIVVRSATQQIRQADYIQAARAMGCSLPYLLLREVLPNLRGPLLVIATVEMASAVLVEATLSFLGLGVPAPLPSWGLMLSEAKTFMFFSPWLITLPGAALVTLVLAINMIGDSMRSVGGQR